jgi:hypothetical protein
LRFRWTWLLVVAALPTACAVEPVQPGDPCEVAGDDMCRTSTVAMECIDGHWAERDCWVECARLDYEVGYCDLNSLTGENSCFCTPGARWAVDGTCSHEGDQSCWRDDTLRVCVAGRVSEVDCSVACAGHASYACGYDPALGDDSCLCCDTPDCP